MSQDDTDMLCHLLFYRDRDMCSYTISYFISVDGHAMLHHSLLYLKTIGTSSVCYISWFVNVCNIPFFGICLPSYDFFLRRLRGVLCMINTKAYELLWSSYTALSAEHSINLFILPLIKRFHPWVYCVINL